MHTGRKDARRVGGCTEGSGLGWLRAAVWPTFLLLLVPCAAVACGEKQPAVSSTVGMVSTSVASPMEKRVFPEVFVEMVKIAGSMKVYGWTDLPEGATIAREWWSVVDLKDPSEYEGPATANPRISGGDAAEPEMQLVLEYQDGWLAVLQNFRGDLGDVRGDQVGTVDGHPAVFYAVDGGALVQWSDGGRWYGVFARGVAADEVVRVALQMQVVGTADHAAAGAAGE